MFIDGLLREKRPLATGGGYQNARGTFSAFQELTLITSKMEVGTSAAASSCALGFLGQAGGGLTVTVTPTVKPGWLELPTLMLDF